MPGSPTACWRSSCIVAAVRRSPIWARCAAPPREPLLALALRDRRFGWPLEMVLRATAAGWAVGEVAVDYGTRVGGASKVSGSWRGSWRALHDMRAVLGELG